ncbi:uncharacterized protein LOC113234395 [Hyposmocoma kahamanoa]|uniref:uncharacterized protein LOC113234395 n=1 Tax=Hyposmocoma kahamanoa TaxID=1477025 RepID=UPI000E6D61A6|nr:uncharacterized protein LOC113234395 [Hyposmocoma kahamanoa]
MFKCANAAEARRTLRDHFRKLCTTQSQQQQHSECVIKEKKEKPEATKPGSLALVRSDKQKIKNVSKENPEATSSASPTSASSISGSSALTQNDKQEVENVKKERPETTTSASLEVIQNYNEEIENVEIGKPETTTSASEAVIEADKQNIKNVMRGISMTLNSFASKQCDEEENTNNLDITIKDLTRALIETLKMKTCIQSSAFVSECDLYNDCRLKASNHYIETSKLTLQGRKPILLMSNDAYNVGTDFSTEYISVQNLQNKRQREEILNEDQIANMREHKKTPNLENIINDVKEFSHNVERHSINRFEDELKCQGLKDGSSKIVRGRVSIVEKTNSKRTFREEPRKYKVTVPEPLNGRASKSLRSHATAENKLSTNAPSGPISLGKFKAELLEYLQTHKRSGDKLFSRVLSTQEFSKHVQSATTKCKVKDKLRNKGTDLELRKGSNGKPSGSRTNSRKEHTRDVCSKLETPRYVDVLVFNTDQHKRPRTVKEPRKEVDRRPSISLTRSGNKTFSHVLPRHESAGYVPLRKLKNKAFSHVLPRHESAGYVPLRKLKNELHRTQDADLESRNKMVTKRPREYSHVFSRNTPEYVDLRKSKEDQHKYQDTITELQNHTDITSYSSLIKSGNESLGHGHSSHESPSHAILCVNELRKLKKNLNKSQDLITESRKNLDKTPSSSSTKSEYELSRQESPRHLPNDELRKYHASDLESRKKESNGKPSISSTRGGKELSQDISSQHVNIYIFNTGEYKYQDTITEGKKINRRPLISSARRGNIFSRHNTSGYVSDVPLSGFKDKLRGDNDTGLEFDNKASSSLATSGRKPLDVFSRNEISRHVYLQKLQKDRRKYQDTIKELQKYIHIISSNTPTRSVKESFNCGLSNYKPLRHVLLPKSKSKLLKKEQRKYQDTATEPRKEVDKWTATSSNSCTDSRYKFAIHMPVSKLKDTVPNYPSTDLELQNQMYRISSTSLTSRKNELSKRDTFRHDPLCKFEDELYKHHDTDNEPQKEMDEPLSSCPTISDNEFSNLESCINHIEPQNKMYAMSSTSPSRCKTEFSECDSHRDGPLCKFKDELRKQHDKVREMEMNVSLFSCPTRSEHELSGQESGTKVSLCKFKDVVCEYQDIYLDAENKTYVTSSTSPTRRKTEFLKHGSRKKDTVPEPQKKIDEVPSSYITRSITKLSTHKSPLQVVLDKFKDYLGKYPDPVSESKKQISGTLHSTLAKTTDILSRYPSYSNASTQHVPLRKFKDELNEYQETVTVSLKRMDETVSHSSANRKDQSRRDRSRKLNVPSRHVPIRKSRDKLYNYQNIVSRPRKEYQSTVTQRREVLRRTSFKSPLIVGKTSSKPIHVPFQIIHKKSEGIVSKVASNITDSNIKIDGEDQEYNKAYKDPTKLVNDSPIGYRQDVCLDLLANFLNAFLLEFHKLMDRQSKLSNIVDSIPKLKKDEEVAMILDDTIKTDDKQGMATKIEYNKRNIQNVPLEKTSTGTKNSKSSFSPQTFPKSRIINTNSLVLDFLRRSDFHRSNLKSSIPIEKSKTRSIISSNIPRIITSPCNIKQDNKKTHSELMLTSLKKQLNVTRRNNSIIKEPNNNFTLSNVTENKLKYPVSNDTNRHVEDKTNAHGIYSNYPTKQATSANFKKNSEKYIKEHKNKHFIRSLRTKTCYMKTKASIRRNQNDIQGSYKTNNKIKKNRAITGISCTRKFNKKKYEISNNKNRCREEYYRNNAKYDIGDSFKSRQTIPAIIDPSLDCKETEKGAQDCKSTTDTVSILYHNTIAVVRVTAGDQSEQREDPLKSGHA